MIVAAGLSPAWQQILVFDDFTVGEVNRAAEALWCASGKVLNVGRAAWSLGASVEIACPLGGSAGEAIRSEFATDDVPACWTVIQAPTRVCTTIIERTTGRVTELVENAPPIREGELEAFIGTYVAAAAQADIAVLAGSVPSVEQTRQPPDVWRRLLAEGQRAILDIRGPELLQVLPMKPFLVKPNLAELSHTVQRSLNKETDVLKGMRQLNAAGAEWALISAGSGDLLLSSETHAWRFTPPRPDVVNPIGCGDCLAGGIAAALDDGAEIVDAVRFGMGAAADNLSQLLPARLNRQRAINFSNRVIVNSL